MVNEEEMEVVAEIPLPIDLNEFSTKLLKIADERPEAVVVSKGSLTKEGFVVVAAPKKVSEKTAERELE